MRTTPTLCKVSQVSLIQFTNYTFRLQLCSASGILTPQMALPLLKQLLIVTMDIHLIINSLFIESFRYPVSVRKLSLAGLASLCLDMNQGFQSSAKYMHMTLES